MAELVNGRIQPRVDLTPMVDLAFLLITFFMLTTSLYKPQAMDVVMPDKIDPTSHTVFADERTMTILLGAQNKVAWYWGLLDNPIEGPAVTNHGKYGIRTEILDKMRKVNLISNDSKELMVIIRPSAQAVYSDLINVLDEMKINHIQQYMIGDITNEEKTLLQKDGL